MLSSLKPARDDSTHKPTHRPINHGDVIFTDHGPEQVGMFDFDEVDRNLGLTEPVQQRDQDFTDAAAALQKVMLFFASSRTVEAAGLRAFSLAFLIVPGAFREQTFAELAETFGYTRQAISKHVREVFNLANGVFQVNGMRSQALRDQCSKRVVLRRNRCSRRKTNKELNNESDTR